MIQELFRIPPRAAPKIKNMGLLWQPLQKYILNLREVNINCLVNKAFRISIIIFDGILHLPAPLIYHCRQIVISQYKIH